MKVLNSTLTQKYALHAFHLSLTVIFRLGNGYNWGLVDSVWICGGGGELNYSIPLMQNKERR